MLQRKIILGLYAFQTELRKMKWSLRKIILGLCAFQIELRKMKWSLRKIILVLYTFQEGKSIEKSGESLRRLNALQAY